MAKKSTFSVSDAVDVLKAGLKATEGADAPVAVLVLVDRDAPRDLAAAVRDALLPERANAEVRVGLLGAATDAARMADVCVVVCGGSPSLARAAAVRAAGRGMPVALVAESSVSLPATGDAGLPDELVSSVVAASGGVCRERLAAWLVDATDKHLAFAASFPFCRRSCVRKLVSACALQNAVVGAVDLVPGADMPVMTANQAKLALETAAAYGHGLGAARAGELAGVVAAGFAYRAVTRRLVDAAPGAGWLVKGAAGYAGTLATGAALRARFEAEASGVTPAGVLEEVAGRVRSAADAASALASKAEGLARRRTAAGGRGLAPLAG